MTTIGNNLRISALIAAFALHPLTPSLMAAEDVKPISSYPTSRKIWLGIEDGKIQPANETLHRSSSEGYITFLKPNGSQLKKGEAWAILDKEQLEIEKRTISLERDKLKEALNNLQQDQDAFVKKQQTSISKLEIQKGDLLASLETDLLSNKLRARIKTAVNELDEQIAKLKDSIAAEELERKRKLSEEELTLALDRKERSHEKLLRRSNLKASFDGILNITLNNPNSPDKLNNPVWLDLGSSYATITDNSHYEILVSNRNPIFGTYDTNKLLAVMDDGKSLQRIRATYKEVRKTDTSGAMRDVHVFEFPEDAQEFAAQKSGEVRTIYLYLVLDEDSHVIPKRDIALAAPEILKNEGWPGLVKHLYPGHTLLHIGPKTLAVTKDNGDHSK